MLIPRNIRDSLRPVNIKKEVAADKQSEGAKFEFNEIFQGIFRLILGGLGLLGISPLFPEGARLLNLPTPPDPLSAIRSIGVGFMFLTVAIQDPDEQSEDSCDATP